MKLGGILMGFASVGFFNLWRITYEQSFALSIIFFIIGCMFLGIGWDEYNN